MLLPLRPAITLGFGLGLCLGAASWLLPLGPAHGAPFAAPTPIPAARYDGMIKKSPFAPATAATPPPPSAPGFAANLYVTGVARIGNRNFVTVLSRDQQSRFSLLEGEKSPEGIEVSKVEWSDEVGKTRVHLKKGKETGVLEFDQALLQKGVAGATAAAGGMPGAAGMMTGGGPAQPGVNPGQPGIITGSNRPAGAGMRRQPAMPRTAPAPVPPQVPVPMPAPAAGNVGGPAVPGPASAQREPRRRIRIINSQPQQ